MDHHEILNVIKSDDLKSLENYIIDGLVNFDSVLRIRCNKYPQILHNSPTLICCAAYYSSSKIFNYLFVNSADMTITDGAKRDISHFASAGGKLEMLFILYNLNMPMNRSDAYGNTCIHYAVMNHHIVATYWLWSYMNLPVNVVNNGNISPLHIATANEECGLINFLCKNGCNVNLKNNMGVTPLHIAASKPNLELVETLMKNGADPSIRDNVGCLPYQFAKEYPHIQGYLLEFANSSVAL